MHKTFSFKFYSHYSSDGFSQKEWDNLVGDKSIFLSTSFVQGLWNALPNNMSLYLIGIFKQEKLVAGVMMQNFIFNKTSPIGFSKIKNKKWYTPILPYLVNGLHVLGNSMISGEHAFVYNEKEISFEKLNHLLHHIVISNDIPVLSNKTYLLLFKDLEQHNFENVNEKKVWKKFRPFEVQPTMILKLNASWNSFEGYVAHLSKKYRARAKSAFEKAKNITKKELNLEDCRMYQHTMFALYLNVVKNAPFNLFVLPEHHFFSLKKHIQDKLKIYAYFLGDAMIGFYTLIENGKNLDTYFLGYDISIQKENKIYLNFLFDMVSYGIKNKFEVINFGRTALEIKSTIGAEPMPLKNLIKHKNSLINCSLALFFSKIYQPETWEQRHPFKKSD